MNAGTIILEMETSSTLSLNVGAGEKPGKSLLAPSLSPPCSMFCAYLPSHVLKFLQERKSYTWAISRLLRHL